MITPLILFFSVHFIYTQYTVIDRKIFYDNQTANFTINETTNNGFTLSFFFRFKFFKSPIQTNPILSIKSSQLINNNFNVSALINTDPNISLQISSYLTTYTNKSLTTSSVNDWYFLAISFKNGLNSFFLKDFSNSYLFDELRNKSNSFVINEGDLIIFNPSLILPFGIEITNVKLEYAFIDFYLKNTADLSSAYYPYLDCDSDCVDCNSQNAVCNQCSDGNVTNNTCPFGNITLLDYKYFVREGNFSKINIKSAMNSQIKTLNSLSFTVSFWIKFLYNKTSYNDTQAIFSLGYGNFTAPSKWSSFPLRVYRYNNRLARALNNMYAIVSYISDDIWYFITIGIDAKNNLFKLSDPFTGNYSLISFNDYKIPSDTINPLNNIFIDPLNEFSEIFFPNVKTFYGILSKLTFHYNKVFSTKDSSYLLCIIILNLANSQTFTQLLDNIIKCKSGKFCGDSVGLYSNSDQSCQGFYLLI